jgi:PAS domain S-box-containing protein
MRARRQLSTARGWPVDSISIKGRYVHSSRTDLVGLQVTAEEFLAAMLDSVAQPIWAVDAAGVIQFANPAATRTLGYDDAQEVLGRGSHETFHYRHLDGSPYPAEECPMRLPSLTGESVTRELDWFVRRDGTMFPVSYTSVPIELPEGRGAVVAFTDIEDRLRVERALREHDAVLAAREGSLRRIAQLVAGGAASPEVFAAIAREVAQGLSVPLVVIWRNPPGEPASVLGAWSDRPHPFHVGSSWPVDQRTADALLPDPDRPTRIDDFGAIGGAIAGAIHDTGMRSGAGAAIIVNGELWGTMGAAVAEGTALDDEIADRLADFTELVATAISSAQARADVERLAEEQAALRRVATLVAREGSPAAVFAAVTEEVGRLLRVKDTKLIRFEGDDTATVVAGWGESNSASPVGSNWSLEGENVSALVYRTRQPARIDDYAQAGGSLAAFLRDVGIRSSVATPVIVEGRLWGAMIAASQHDEPLPASTESRIGEFTALVATAISNMQARSDLAASRARIVATADKERQRVVRDLHDGAQQRLVHTIITLKLLRAELETREQDVPALLTEAIDHAESAKGELRELVHGIRPAVLTHGGLRAAVQELATRMPVPVENDACASRFSATVEGTAYFVIAEALTNVAKHAQAERAWVTVQVEDRTLRVQVRDNGVGGAQPEASGLVGLGDRLAAIDGRFSVESPADGGTLVVADIPIPG